MTSELYKSLPCQGTNEIDRWSLEGNEDDGVVVISDGNEGIDRDKETRRSSCAVQCALPAPCSVKHLEQSTEKELEGFDVLEICDQEITCSIPKKVHQRTPAFSSRILSVFKERRGLLFALFSAALYSVKNLIVEIVITNKLNLFQMIVMVMPASTVGSLMWLVSKNIKPPTELSLYLWLLFSGFLFTSFSIFFALSIQYLDVGDSVTVCFTSLIQVGIMSWIVLREPLRLLDMGFAVLAFVGVIFVAKPSFIFGSDNSNEDTMLGVCFALVASFSIALLYVVYRKQHQLGIDTFVSIFANSIVTVITSAVCCTALRSWSCPTSQEWVFVELAGIVYFMAQAFAYYALHFEAVTLVVVTMTLEIVFTFLLQFVVLNISPVWMSYIGTLLIMGSCVGITLATHRCQKRESEVSFDTS